jgi:hypothetical protein
MFWEVVGLEQGVQMFKPFIEADNFIWVCKFTRYLDWTKLLTKIRSLTSNTKFRQYPFSSFGYRTFWREESLSQLRICFAQFLQMLIEQGRHNWGSCKDACDKTNYIYDGAEFLNLTL